MDLTLYISTYLLPLIQGHKYVSRYDIDKTEEKLRISIYEALQLCSALDNPSAKIFYEVQSGENIADILGEVTPTSAVFVFIHPGAIFEGFPLSHWFQLIFLFNSDIKAGLNNKDELSASFEVTTGRLGGNISGAWDDPTYFNYSGEDYAGFLTSLGSFVVDYGDGTKEVIRWDNENQGYSHTYNNGIYTLKFYGTNYVFVSSDCITKVINLSTALQGLYLGNCTSLTTPPVLTGLTALQGLYLGNCKLVTSGVNAILTALTPNTYEVITNVNLSQTPPAVPTPATKNAFIVNHPTCNLSTD